MTKTKRDIPNIKPLDSRWISFWVPQKLFTRFKIQVARLNKSGKKTMQEMVLAWTQQMEQQQQQEKEQQHE